LIAFILFAFKILNKPLKIINSKANKIAIKKGGQGPLKLL